MQLHKDMGAAQWIKYDQDFREWAAAKGVRKWGELNLPIYGHCLSIQQRASSMAPIVGPIVGTNAGRQKRDRRRKSSSNSETKRGSCFKWNFERSCSRIDCHYTHDCYHCGEDYGGRLPPCTQEIIVCNSLMTVLVIVWFGLNIESKIINK